MTEALLTTHPNDALSVADVPDFYSEADLNEQRLIQEASQVEDKDFDAWFNSLSGPVQVKYAIGLCMTRASRKGSESCRDLLQLMKEILEEN